MILAQNAQKSARSAQNYDGSAQTTERSAKLRVFRNSFDFFSLISLFISEYSLKNRKQ